MAQLLQRILTGPIFLAGALFIGAAAGPRFYPDDPLLREPKPLPVGKLKAVKLSDSGDFIQDTFREPGEKQSHSHPTASLDVNTADELPDSAWYTNRHYYHPMSAEQLRRGPDGQHPPDTNGLWTIFEAKIEGVSPGFRIQDATGEKYVLKFDPIGHIDMATAADVIGARIFFALGYNVPDNYPVRFRRGQLRLDEKVKFRRNGSDVTMEDHDLDRLLTKVPQYADGRYRAVASRVIPGELIGPFQYYGTRPDDPNDTIPHERRRVLRGLYVPAAWLDHTDSRAVNTLDAIQDIEGVRAVRHYLIDFGATLGSDTLIPKEAWHGHEYYVDLRRGIKAFTTLGLWAPEWVREQVRQPAAVGRFDSDTFEPDKWQASYPNPAFDNRTAADGFWAAKQIAALTDEELRAIVEAGAYSDSAAAAEVLRVLIVRRNRTAQYWFSQLLPLDGFRVDSGELKFRDLGGNGKYTVAWSEFDNLSRASRPIAGEGSFRLPNAAGFLRAEVTDGIHRTSVFIHGEKVVGVER